jgi:hypothetical protein
MRRRTSKIVLVAAALALASTAAPAGAHPDDWTTYQSGIRRDGRHDSRINRTNVALLRPKWTKHTSESVTATPAVAVFDDFDPATPGDQPKKVVYVGAATGIFYALDAADGSELWTFEAEAAPGLGYHMFVSSATIDRERGRLYVGGGFTMYALDLLDGSVVWRWSTQNTAAGRSRPRRCFSTTGPARHDLLRIRPRRQHSRRLAAMAGGVRARCRDGGASLVLAPRVAARLDRRGDRRAADQLVRRRLGIGRCRPRSKASSTWRRRTARAARRGSTTRP